jgi:hypothetical protein
MKRAGGREWVRGEEHVQDLGLTALEYRTISTCGSNDELSMYSERTTTMSVSACDVMPDWALLMSAACQRTSQVLLLISTVGFHPIL